MTKDLERVTKSAQKLLESLQAQPDVTFKNSKQFYSAIQKAYRYRIIEENDHIFISGLSIDTANNYEPYPVSYDVSEYTHRVMLKESLLAEKMAFEELLCQLGDYLRAHCTIDTLL